MDWISISLRWLLFCCIKLLFLLLDFGYGLLELLSEAGTFALTSFQLQYMNQRRIRSIFMVCIGFWWITILCRIWFAYPFSSGSWVLEMSLVPFIIVCPVFFQLVWLVLTHTVHSSATLTHFFIRGPSSMMNHCYLCHYSNENHTIFFFAMNHYHIYHNRDKMYHLAPSAISFLFQPPFHQRSILSL